MCGEEVHEPAYRGEPGGSPPHVRGRAIAINEYDDFEGITPACAGKRISTLSSAPAIADHPRMCGEEHSGMRPCGHLQGSPPHVRGRGPAAEWEDLGRRITPACAGKRG